MPGRTASRGLAELIRALAKIDGLERIRYTTSHPADMTDALIAAHGEVDKLMPYLHLAGAVGQQPHPQGDEPQPHGRNLSRAHSRRCARPAPTSPFRRLHRRLPRRDRRGFRSDAAASSTRSRYASAYSFKYSAAAGHARRRRWRTRSRATSWTSGCSGCRTRINAHQLAFNRSKVGMRHADPDRAQGQARRAR